MSNEVRFGDHTTFHLQVLRVTIAGAVLGVCAYLATFLPWAGNQAVEAMAMALAAMALGLSATPPSRKGALVAGLMALGIALIGVLCYLAMTGSPPYYRWFGIFVYGSTVGIIAGRDLRDRRRFLLPVATGLSVMLAAFVVTTFARQLDFTSYVPALVAAPAYGALFGFLTGVALVVRQIWITQDPVGQAFAEVKPFLSGEMRDLCGRAVELYRRVQEVLRDRRENGSSDPELSRAVQDMVLRIFALGRKWHEVEREAARTSADDLKGRVADLDAKVAGTKDPVAQKQYRQAREALGSQLRYLEDISRNRERVTAQVYNYVAALERLHLAVLNHRGADAAKLTDEIQPIFDEIDDVGQEMELVSDAMNEAAEAAQAAEEPAPVPTDEVEIAAEEVAAPEPSDTPETEDEADEKLAAAEAPLQLHPAPADADGDAEDDAEARLASRMFEDEPDGEAA